MNAIEHANGKICTYTFHIILYILRCMEIFESGTILLLESFASLFFSCKCTQAERLQHVLAFCDTTERRFEKLHKMIMMIILLLLSLLLFLLHDGISPCSKVNFIEIRTIRKCAMRFVFLSLCLFFYILIAYRLFKRIFSVA